MTARFHSSPPDRWVMPRPTRDPRRDGPLQPLEEGKPRRSLLQGIRAALGERRT